MKLCALTRKLGTRLPVNAQTIAACCITVFTIILLIIMRKHIISLKKTNVLCNKYIIKLLLENIQEQIVLKRTNLFQEQIVLQKTDFLVNFKTYFSKITTVFSLIFCCVLGSIN
jgi:hypothetical protein